MKIDEKLKNEKCWFACQWFVKIMDGMTAITLWALQRDFCKRIGNLSFHWSENWLLLTNTCSNSLIELSSSTIFIDKFDHITHSSLSIVNFDPVFVCGD